MPALIEIAAGAATGVILVRRQLKLPAPLLPVDLLRRPVFALSLMTSISSFGAQALAIVSLPFYFEDRLGHSATTTGLLLTPWPVATALIAPIAGRLADRFIPGLLGSIGLLVMEAGSLLSRSGSPIRTRSRLSGGWRSAASASASSSRPTTG